MVDGGKSCFRSSERKVVSTPPLRADLTQQLSPRTSHGPLRKTTLFQAFLQQEVSHRFVFTYKTCCLFNCWLYGIVILFSPNNLKRKALCGSDLLSPAAIDQKKQRIVHFCDKSLKLCQITNIPNTNISGYGARPNSPLDSSTAHDSKWPT